MDECLVCGLDKEESSDERCKMCGMHIARKPSLYKNFVFCSESCRSFFQRIENTDAGIACREIVI